MYLAYILLILEELIGISLRINALKHREGERERERERDREREKERERERERERRRLQHNNNNVALSTIIYKKKTFLTFKLFA
jgi:hypothetical protein